MGDLSVNAALLISIGCCLFMLFGAYSLSTNTFIAAIFLIVGFWTYSFINKHFGLLANIWVAVCSSLAFLCGATVYGLTDWVLFAMIVTFFINIGREILLDALDQVGDQAVGKPSIPLRFGAIKTFQLVGLLFIMGTIVSGVFVWTYPNTWLWIVMLLLSLWIPFMMRKANFHAWALFNVRTSHVFFLLLIVLLFLRPS